MTPLRVAVLAESETDDAVAREIVAHVRRSPVEPVLVPSLQTRGWPAVLRQLPQVVRTVYYRSDADALVVLADTDAGVPHDPRTHGQPHPDCRWCMLHAALARTLAQIQVTPGRTLRVAIGTPVPAIEAWLLADHASRPSEAAWLQRGSTAGAGAVAYKRRLKQFAYGSAAPRTNAPTNASVLIRGVLAKPGLLRTAFPGGYGPLEDAILAW